MPRPKGVLFDLSPGNSSSSWGSPPGVQPASERAVSAVLRTKRLERSELLGSPLYDAALSCGRNVTTISLPESFPESFHEHRRYLCPCPH